MTNKAEMRPEEQGEEKKNGRVVGRIYGMEYS